MNESGEEVVGGLPSVTSPIQPTSSSNSSNSSRRGRNEVVASMGAGGDGITSSNGRGGELMRKKGGMHHQPNWNKHLPT